MNEKNKKPSFSLSIINAFIGFLQNIPILIGIIGMVGIFQTFVSSKTLEKIFTGNPYYDMFIGTFVGSISAGQPLVSYIIGGELLKRNISMFAVAAFIISWVTIGIIQLPLEVKFMGKRFTLYRNILALIFSFLLSAATVVSISVF